MPFTSLNPPPNLFQTYLGPSLPFRRRHSSTDSAASASSDATTTSKTSSNLQGTAGQSSAETYLTTRGTSHLRCARCFADLALSSQIVSKGFTGRHGRAYLVAPSSPPPTTAASSHHSSAKAKSDALPNLPNTYTLKPVPRQLVTGAHTVGDLSCAQCGSILGWKYVAAEEAEQRYKVGKFILETKRVCRSSMWEGGSEEDVGLGSGRRGSSGLSMPPNELAGGRGVEGEVEFDSQDEEECEDLFMGVWTPQLAAKKRRLKGFGREE